ncbi:MAG: hypothetical protein NVSMB22_12650 [Chloroflexota bacterium]
MDDNHAAAHEAPSSVTSAGPDNPARALSGPSLLFDIRAELDHVRRQKAYQDAGPSGRTLVKEPDLRIVLMALRNGARLEEHETSGPVSIQAIEGRLHVRLPDGGMELRGGQLLALEAGIAHDITALEDCAFLLTIGRTTYQHVSDHHEPSA